MVNTFQLIFDFTNNLEMVIRAFEHNLKDERFLNELFVITNIILKNMITANMADKLITFEHFVIEHLAKIAKLYDYADAFLLKWIYALDIGLNKCDQVRQFINFCICNAFQCFH